MVTWGSNTVHSIPGTPAAAPATSPFGAPAPSPSGGFLGAPSPSSTGYSFGGASAPSPSSGGIFSGGSPFGAPSPAPGSSFFATPSSAPGSSFFNAPSSGSSLFGNTMSSSLFGSSAPSPFGQSQQPQQPQIPAQAALHAHQEAMNRAETEKIKAELSKLYAIYSGAITPSTSSDSKTNFVSIVYNDLTQEQRQLQWLHGIGAGGQIMPIAPPQPPQVSEEEWNKAVVHNPDPLSYMPVPMVGADNLSARVSWQHERAKQLAKDAECIKASHETVKDLFAQGQKRLEEIRRAHSNHRKRLLNVMRKVEVVRCMNQSLQPDEVRAMEELRKLEHETQRTRNLVAELEIRSRSARPQQHAAAAAIMDVSIPDRERLAKVLQEHREDLMKVSQTLSKDIRDLELMTERVIVPQLGGPPRGSR